MASNGHVRDLPKSQLGFSPENAPYYVVLQFDNSKEIELHQNLKINKGFNRFKARIAELNEIQ